MAVHILEQIMKLWNSDLSNLVLEMLGADDAAFVFVSASGNIVSLTAGAEQLLRQPPLRPIAEVLSEHAARAVRFVLESGGESALDEEIDDQLYRLEVRAAQEGALLYFYPAAQRTPSMPLGLSGQIAGSLSHILAVLHLLPGANGEKQSLLLEDIRRSSLRIYRGLTHLQLLEHTGDPEQLLRLGEHDLSALCHRLAAQCRAVCASRDISALITVEAPAHCVVAYDEALMTRAILNLLSNALHAPAVSLVHLRLRRQHGRVTLTVADNGSGLSAEALGRLYHGWARTQDENELLKQKGDGLSPGLGLPLVRRIAGWHSGTLLLESSDAGGTIFHFTFADDLRVENFPLGQSVFEETLDTSEMELAVL